jgi:hypothetical protein
VPSSFSFARGKSLLALIFPKRFVRGYDIFDGIESLELVGDSPLQDEVLASTPGLCSTKKCHKSLSEKQKCL